MLAEYQKATSLDSPICLRDFDPVDWHRVITYDDFQCAAITRRGTRCSRPVMDRAWMHCTQHDRMAGGGKLRRWAA